MQYDQKIYINDDYFPEDYATDPYYHKLNAIKNTIDVLMHETDHAIDSYRDDLYRVISDCFENTSLSPSSLPPHSFNSWYANRRYNYQERL